MEKEKILEKLKEVIDPELGFDIVSLGLIEEISIEENKVKIKLLPTTPFCPYLPLIIELIENKLREIGFESEIEIDLENIWSLERVDEEVKKSLNL
ncbi:MAG: metal-sulfur cluster assembly factor [Candidatus Aenigmatarchaeota archaeon]